MLKYTDNEWLAEFLGHVKYDYKRSTLTGELWSVFYLKYRSLDGSSVRRQSSFISEIPVIARNFVHAWRIGLYLHHPGGSRRIYEGCAC
jgi:hypothetical protein